MSATIPNQPASTPDGPAGPAGEQKAIAGTISPERAGSFYDRLRKRIHLYVARKGRMAERSTEYLLLVPDIFMLLWRLTTDSRVSGRNKVLLGSGLAYFILPIDILPEEFLGPLGYIDDLVFAVYILNRMLADTDPQILRDHWSGDEDVLATIQKVLGAADSLMGRRASKRMNSTELEPRRGD